MRKNKISFFIPTLESGGVEAMTVNLINELVRKGYEVDLLVINSRGPIKKKISPQVNIIDFNKKRILHAIPLLVQYYRCKKPRVLFTALSHVNFVSIIAKKIAFSKVEIITSTRNLDSAAPKNKTQKLIQKYTIKNSYKHIAITNIIKTRIKENINVAKDNIYVINNPILINSTPNIRDKKVKEKKEILTVGRLEPIKNQFFLIDVMAELIKENKNIFLTIVGDGTLKKDLISKVRKKKLESHINITGYQSNVSKYYKIADLFVLPSLKEGLGNVVVEAMSYSLPIIVAQNSGGPEEILKEYYDNTNNFYIQNSIQDLSKKIMDNLETNNENKKYNLEKYTVTVICQKYLDLLKDIKE